MPATGESIRVACNAYVSALNAARASAVTEEAFWQDKLSNRAYRRVMEAAHEGNEELRAGFALFEVLGSFASNVWAEGEADAAAGVRLAERVVRLVEQLSATAWLGITALENRFSGFPEYTELDGIAILNLNVATDENSREVLARFERLLIAALRFPPRGSTTAQQSYYDLDEHYFKNKTRGFIPIRPMVVLRLGSASELDAYNFYDWSLRSFLPLLLLCQLAYDLRRPATVRILRTRDPLVNALTIDSDSLVALPDVALGLDTATGASAVWHRPFPLFEELHGVDYKAAVLVDLWREIASPLIRARESAIPPKVMDTIERCVRFVSDCRHRTRDDIALHSVIAIESLLSLFQPSESISERFRTFGAALIAKDGPRRIEAYDHLGRLYSFRSKLVHTAGRDAELEAGDATFAFESFLTCLKEVLGWAVQQVEASQPCDAASFKAFFLERVFSGGT